MSSIEISPRVAERVADEQVIWLTTVDTDGRPVPTPVWFLWSDDEVLVFSRPDTPKLRNIGENDRVALNLNSSSSGGDVAVLTARARIDPDGPNPAEWSEFTAKYTDGFVAISQSPDEFRDTYSTLIRIHPQRIRSW